MSHEHIREAGRFCSVGIAKITPGASSGTTYMDTNARLESAKRITHQKSIMLIFGVFISTLF